MKVGDIIINPHVREKMDNGRPNPMYKSMVIHIGSEYTRTLRYDGKISKYYTQNVKKWEISHHINLEKFMEEE
jgi:hypothetical protein